MMQINQARELVQRFSPDAQPSLYLLQFVLNFGIKQIKEQYAARSQNEEAEEQAAPPQAQKAG